MIVTACTSCKASGYRAQATLEIRPEPSSATSATQMEDLFRAQVLALKGMSIIEQAIAVLPEQIRREYNAKDLASRLDVQSVRNSFVLRINLIDPDPERASQIVNTLVAVYLKQVEKNTTFTVRVIEAANVTK